MSPEEPARGVFADKPTSGVSEGEKDALRDRCRNERDSMEPHETADCAGMDLADAYENEEDGGS